MLAIRNGIGLSRGAAAISRVPGPKRHAAATIVLPTPKRAEMRRAVSAASNGPMFPTANARPIVAAVRPSSRTA